MCSYVITRKISAYGQKSIDNIYNFSYLFAQLIYLAVMKLYEYNINITLIRIYYLFSKSLGCEKCYKIYVYSRPRSKYDCMKVMDFTCWKISLPFQSFDSWLLRKWKQCREALGWIIILNLTRQWFISHFMTNKERSMIQLQRSFSDSFYII